MGSCTACWEKTREIPTNKAHKHIPVSSTAVNQTLWLDTMGPLKDVHQGDKPTPYVLTMMDGFSRYAKAVALPDHKAPTVATAVLNEWISSFGAPVEIRTDRGSEFLGSHFDKMCKDNGIKHTTTTPDLHNSNPIERLHGSLMDLVRSRIAENAGNFADTLPTVCLLYTSPSPRDRQKSRMPSSA